MDGVQREKDPYRDAMIRRSNLINRVCTRRPTLRCGHAKADEDMEDIFEMQERMEREAQVKFNQFDRDSSGTIDRAELRDMLVHMGKGKQLSDVMFEQFLQDMFDKYDEDNYARLGHTEVVYLEIPESSVPEFAKEYWKLFVGIDRNDKIYFSKKKIAPSFQKLFAATFRNRRRGR